MKPINPDSLFFIKVFAYGEYKSIIATCAKIDCPNRAIFVNPDTCSKCFIATFDKEHARMCGLFKEEE